MDKPAAKGDVAAENAKLEWLETLAYLEDAKNTQQQGMREKFFKKVKENPFVPIGVIATTMALSVGLWSMKVRDVRLSQKMMRARVGAQGFTVFALLVGVAVSSLKKKSDSEE